jgi:hypothetical protein
MRKSCPLYDDDQADRQVDIKDRSFSRKMVRAANHIDELAGILAAFAERHPYEVTVRTDRKGKHVHRFEFTEAPPADIPLIVGDVLYNLRSGFDHLIGALVPRSQRSKVLFPLLTEPVWDIPPSKGENEDLRRNREKWESLTKKIKHPDAIPILQGLQPLTSKRVPPLMHPLDLLNKLSNKDRHQDLPVVLAGLDEPKVKLVMRGTGEIRPVGVVLSGPYSGMADKAVIPVDEKVAYVKVRGTAVAVVRFDAENTNALLPDRLIQIMNWIVVEAIGPLAPYVLD